MPDTDDTTTDTEPDDGAERRLAGERDTARAEADAARRELVFAKAGIDTDSAQGKLALDGYKGELTVDAVKGWHAEVFGAPAINASEVSEGERRLTDDRQFVATGGDPGPAQHEAEHPHIRGMAAAGEAWRTTFDRDKAASAFLGQVLTAAAEGDGRVILRTVSADGAQRPVNQSR